MLYELRNPCTLAKDEARFTDSSQRDLTCGPSQEPEPTHSGDLVSGVVTRRSRNVGASIIMQQCNTLGLVSTAFCTGPKGCGFKSQKRQHFLTSFLKDMAGTSYPEGQSLEFHKKAILYVHELQRFPKVN